MKEIIKITVIFLLFSICSCSENKNNILDFKNTQKIDVECFVIPYSDILGVSLQLLKKDCLLLINDFHGDSLIHVFDLKNNIEHNKLFSKGVGPNEFISPLAIYMTDSVIYIYERQSSRLFSFSAENLLADNKEITRKFTLDRSSNILFPLTDSMFISSDIDDGMKRFGVYNNVGEKVNEFGEYHDYWYKENDFPNRVRAFYHLTFFEKHPSEKMFVAYSGHILGIYNYESINQTPILLKEFLLSKYEYMFVNNDMMLSTERSDGIERGIIAVSCSSKYIYIVYNPNKEGRDNKLTHNIQIIDWNGKPISIINTNKKISCLTIDETEHRGYIIAEDPEDTLMYFTWEK